MRVAISRISVIKLKLYASDSHDDINVTLEDYEPDGGKISIECAGGVWTNTWPAMGHQTVAQFVATCSVDYLADKLAPEINRTSVDISAIASDVRLFICRQRRKWFMTAGAARQMFDAANVATRIEDHRYLLDEVYGLDWWRNLPECSNPEYRYLSTIIQNAQEGIRAMNTAPAQLAG